MGAQGPTFGADTFGDALNKGLPPLCMMAGGREGAGPASYSAGPT
ncbi:hypothetical protein [Micromonospora sp. NPDC047134]